MNTLHDRVARLTAQRLVGIRRGIEKEGLRVLPEGGLALTPHPLALGAALTHPSITTDYSESQLELITGAHLGVQECLDELTQVHQFVLRTLQAQGGELLWASSMPAACPRMKPFPSGAMATRTSGAPKAFTAWGWHTATGGVCRPSRAFTTTGRCPA